MSDDERISSLEHRVRELQTAVAAMVRHFGIEYEIDAAERARIDKIGAEGNVPSRHVSELYARGFHAP